MNHQKVLVLGASGACGQWAVRVARARGHHVTVLVRSETDYEKPPGVDLIKGNVLDADTLEQAIEGQDAVLSCLGIKRKSSNPWSPLVSPANLTRDSALNIVQAMEKQGVKRLIALSAAGVGDSHDKINPVINFVIHRSNIAKSYRDLDDMEQVYGKCDLDSLVVRPVLLVDGQTTDRARLVDFHKFSSRIARSDVAGWMVDAIERTAPFETPAEMIAGE